MGLLDNIRGFFSSSKNSQPMQLDDENEKQRLAEKIVNLIGKIKKINSFDSSIWNLSNVSSYELKNKSLDELRRLNSSLESRLAELDRKSQSTSSNRESLEASKWTGQKTQNMTNKDFDRFQRSDDYR